MTNPFALDTPPAPPTSPAPPTAPAQPAAPVPTPPPAAGGEDPFDAPAPRMGKRPRLREMYGRLLLIVPKKLEEGIQGRFKGRDGSPQTQDRMTADVVILDGGTIHYGGAPEKTVPIPHDKVAEVPFKVDAMFISATGLISQCRVALSKKVTQGRPGMVLGRLKTGEAKGDDNPPYILTPATDADKQVARAYLANVDPFA